MTVISVYLQIKNILEIIRDIEKITSIFGNNKVSM